MAFDLACRLVLGGSGLWVAVVPAGVRKDWKGLPLRMAVEDAVVRMGRGEIRQWGARDFVGAGPFQRHWPPPSINSIHVEDEEMLTRGKASLRKCLNRPRHAVEEAYQIS